MPTRVRPGRPALVLGAVVLALALAVAGFRLWDRMVEDRLARWAVGEVDRRTGGAYRLVLGDLSFLPFAGSIGFDSAVVVTDSALNRRRPEPLPGLTWLAHRCRVSGLDVVRLVFRKAFAAREVGCERVTVALAMRPPAPEADGAAVDSAESDGVVEELAPPLGLTAVEVADLSFPALSLTLQRPRAGGGTSALLEHARLGVKRLVFHPTAAPGGRTISAERARLSATGLVLRPDSLTEIAVAGAEAELTDSTLRLAGAKHEPAISEAEWVRKVRVRRDRIRFELDSLHARGVGYLAFLATGDIGIRALELRGARLDVLTDKRIPRGPPSRFRTPQRLAAGMGNALRLDTVVVTGGSVVYREREPERERPGRVSFDALRAMVLDLHLPSRGRPLRISARARLMNEGALAAEAVVPLDAPDFRYDLSGTVGGMPAPAFNRFLSENEAFEFGEGVVDGIAFRQTVRAGRAVTAVTPRYRELSVKPTGDGGGVLGSVKRAVKKFVANAFVVRSRNPGEDGEDLRTGRVVSRYLPTTTWVQFVWFGLRDGLNEAMRE